MDDKSGKKLNSKLVERARKAEICTLKHMGVFIKVPRAQAVEAMRRGAKLIDVRWLDVDKAAEGEVPGIRSRCVAKEFADKYKDDIFADTPALEAIRMMISMVASSAKGAMPQSRRLMAMDIKRAFLYADMPREMYINLPSEALDKGDGDVVGLLVKAMYGTRDAPQSWQRCVTEVLEKIGFVAGKGNPCVFYHSGRDMNLSVHVDDLLVAGHVPDLVWLQNTLKKYFDHRASILGDGPEEVKEIRYINRKIRWHSWGITYEHDQVHVVNLLDELGMKDATPVHTPGVKDEKEVEEEERGGGSKELTKDQETQARRVIAILNYMSQHRGDIGYSVKEVAREMSKPNKITLQKVRRIVRYLRRYPICRLDYRWQVDPQSFVTYSDSDWGGCVRTRRSTSGGVSMRGSHPIKFWSRTQSSVSLSSAEAELNALIKASCETIGLLNMVLEMGGFQHKGFIKTDSSAANGAVHRLGAGKLKHLETHKLWIQEKSAKGELDFKKICREAN